MQTDSPGVNLMPPAVFFTCLIGGVILEWVFPSRIPLLPAGVGAALGAVIGLAGFLFMVYANDIFKRAGTNVPTNLPATAIISHGAYQFSRNPMYVGGAAFFIGIALTAGSIWLLVAFIPLAVYLIGYVIPREEAYMKRTFKDEYRDYCSRVRRWL